MKRCRCGCGRRVRLARRQFASRDCYCAFMRGPGNPGRKVFSAEARAAALVARRRNAIARAERFTSKREAYDVGYRTGYNRAYRYFKRKGRAA